MGKTVLHNLIDLLNENDTDTIYNVLIKFIPSDAPLPDEVMAIRQAEDDIEQGNVLSLSAADL